MMWQKIKSYYSELLTYRDLAWLFCGAALATFRSDVEKALLLVLVAIFCAVIAYMQKSVKNEK